MLDKANFQSKNMILTWNAVFLEYFLTEKLHEKSYPLKIAKDILS